MTRIGVMVRIRKGRIENMTSKGLRIQVRIIHDILDKIRNDMT